MNKLLNLKELRIVDDEMEIDQESADIRQHLKNIEPKRLLDKKRSG